MKRHQDSMINRGTSARPSGPSPHRPPSTPLEAHHILIFLLALALLAILGGTANMIWRQWQTMPPTVAETPRPVVEPPPTPMPASAAKPAASPLPKPTPISPTPILPPVADDAIDRALADSRVPSTHVQRISTETRSDARGKWRCNGYDVTLPPDLSWPKLRARLVSNLAGNRLSVIEERGAEPGMARIRVAQQSRIIAEALIHPMILAREEAGPTLKGSEPPLGEDMGEDARVKQYKNTNEDENNKKQIETPVVQNDLDDNGTSGTKLAAAPIPVPPLTELSPKQTETDNAGIPVAPAAQPVPKPVDVPEVDIPSPSPVSKPMPESSAQPSVSPVPVPVSKSAPEANVFPSPPAPVSIPEPVPVPTPVAQADISPLSPTSEPVSPPVPPNPATQPAPMPEPVSAPEPAPVSEENASASPPTPNPVPEPEPEPTSHDSRDSHSPHNSPPPLPEPAAQPTPKPAERVLIASAKGGRPQLAVILDDGGYGGPDTEQALTLDPKLTLAILPNTPSARSTAQRAAAAGFEVMLHMPMETAVKGIRAVTGQLDTSMNQDSIRRLTLEALAQVPGAKGVNYHTGGKFIQDYDRTRWFMEVVRDQRLYFIDSRTTGRSAGHAAAAALGVRTADRDVFLDNESAPVYIRRQFELLVDGAQKRGAAVGIGHFRHSTIVVLHELLPKLSSRGIELVHVSELLP